MHHDWQVTFVKIPTTLIIMDGYGLGPADAGNAVAAARRPVLLALRDEYPHTTLQASGENVGLPAGQIGNSEVGHTNIGAGRVVYQDLSRITRDVKSGAFFENPVLRAAAAPRGNGALHLFGLLSPGGVHSHTDHVWALLELAKRCGRERVYLHCFMDGRDTPPRSGIDSITELQRRIRALGVGRIATVIGRFYAMDRDKRWDRVERAYNAIVLGEGKHISDPEEAVRLSYAEDLGDEFIEPVVCCEEGLVRPGDSIIFYNFRPDRARELTRAFTDPDFDGFRRKNGFFPVDYVCMTQYEEGMPGVTVAYPPEELKNTFGEKISEMGLTQFRIAETEKYAHVTFFFNGGEERVFPGEDRKLIPSPKQFPTYDMIPEMSADAVADEAVRAILSGRYDVVIINFANCDMVGHTGVFEAAVAAVEKVDECVGRVVEATKQMGGIAIVTADHGNAEQMLEPDGVTPHTAHTTNLVPFILVGASVSLRPGRLADVAPTMLDLMGLEKPAEMTGESLVTPV